MVCSRVRRALAAGIGLLLLPALSGCAAVQAVGHVRGAAESAGRLATSLHGLSGVDRATVRYDPADLKGEAVHVGVELAATATASDWVAVTRRLRTSLSGGELAPVRPVVRLHSPGADGATVEIGGSGAPWQSTDDLADRLTRWGALRSAAGVSMRFDQTAVNGGATWFRIEDAADARRFVERARTLGPLLDRTSVVGPGFSGTGPAPAGTARLYRLALRDHVAGRPWSSTVPDGEVASVTWGPGTVQVMTWAPGTTSRWSADDLTLAAAVLARPARDVPTMFSWQNPATAAVVTVGDCAHGHLVAQPDDVRLAAAITAAGHRVPRSGGAGACSG